MNEYCSIKSNFFTFKEFIKLEENCKKFVIEAENDPQKQFLVGQYLFEGQDFYPQNPQIGIKYLKKIL